MMKVIKTTIVSIAVCLSLTASGLAQSVALSSGSDSAVFQRDKTPEKPKERDKPKDDRRDERRDDKKDDKKKRP